MSESIRVLIADDHPLYRDGLRGMLADHPTICCVGEAATGGEALTKVRSSRPDVVLMDLHMPGMDGIEATRRLTAALPDTAVLVLTMFEDDSSVIAALRAGARGYLLKGAAQDDIVRAIESVDRGELILGAHVADGVLPRLWTSPSDSPPFPALTDRERQVLELLAGGASNERIGRTLAISDKTVRNHISNILMKLGVADRVQAVIKARDAGLGGA